MDRSMTENGRMEKSMVVECGKDKIVILILENGRRERSRDSEYLLQHRVTDMKVNSNARKSMD